MTLMPRISASDVHSIYEVLHVICIAAASVEFVVSNKYRRSRIINSHDKKLSVNALTVQ